MTNDSITALFIVQ